jgi:hypothetical protein
VQWSWSGEDLLGVAGCCFLAMSSQDRQSSPGPFHKGADAIMRTPPCDSSLKGPPPFRCHHLGGEDFNMNLGEDTHMLFMASG